MAGRGTEKIISGVKRLSFRAEWSVDPESIERAVSLKMIKALTQRTQLVRHSWSRGVSAGGWNYSLITLDVNNAQR
jgi:hypothetical protein